MRPHRPFITYLDRNTYSVVQKSYKTYDLLRKDLPNIIPNVGRDLYNEDDERIIHVTRTRRGEWGQWFENWDENLKIIKQGWM